MPSKKHPLDLSGKNYLITLKSESLGSYHENVLKTSSFISRAEKLLESKKISKDEYFFGEAMGFILVSVRCTKRAMEIIGQMEEVESYFEDSDSVRRL